MESPSDAELVERLRAGDAGAFDVAYGQLRTRVFSFVLRLVGRREPAEDLAQETWLRLAGNAASLRADTRLAPWLFTVARNLCMSYWRSRGVDPTLPRALTMGERADLATPSPARVAEGHELGSLIERALATLSIHDREALLLVGVEGMTPADASTVCGLRAEAFRKRLERARTRLAAALAALEQPTRRLTGGGP
ncbi:MAG: RNA polymerase sigma factor [Acidobacteriota bacterium]